MGELHSEGKTAEDIRGSLTTAPLSPHAVAAIKTAYALGYVLSAACRPALRMARMGSFLIHFHSRVQILSFFHSPVMAMWRCARMMHAGASCAS